MARLQFHCSPASTLHGAFLHESTAARPVEFRYADPPKAGFNRANALPLVRRRRTARSFNFADALPSGKPAFVHHREKIHGQSHRAVDENTGPYRAGSQGDGAKHKTRNNRC